MALVKRTFLATSVLPVMAQESFVIFMVANTAIEINYFMGFSVEYFKKIGY
jgi:hypothetical protein